MYPVARKDDLILQDVGGETLVYDRLRDRAHSLSPVAAFVFKQADGRRSVAEIAALMDGALSEGSDVALAQRAVDELRGVDLLEHDVDAPRPRPLSRRAAVQRLGVALAVPLVTSIVAPTPLMAQSNDKKPKADKGPKNDKRPKNDKKPKNK